jgi:hypothetical protein
LSIQRKLLKKEKPPLEEAAKGGINAMSKIGSSTHYYLFGRN